ncbi:MAG: sugar phosphate isomerase/epimerase [Planctomycetales bacterium]|nr:sugar phosphate isomerase/epimerase [Planctomycetales bacterium]
MQSASRRDFLRAASATALAAGATAAWGIEPFKRTNPRLSGLGLTTYSLRRHLKWFKGKPTGGKLDIPAFLDYCARLGLDGAELTSYFFELPVEASQINTIKRRAHLNALDITGGAIGNNFAHAPGSDDALQQLDEARMWIDVFAELGAPTIRIFAGKAGGDVSVDQAIKNVQANTEIALAHAEKRGVMLAMENHDFTTDVDNLLRIVKAIDSDWLGVCWDSANLARTADPYADLARIAPFAVAAQLKVMTRVDDKPVEADFARLVKILRDAGYAGYLIFEYEEAEDPYEAIPKFLPQLRAAMQA